MAAMKSERTSKRRKLSPPEDEAVERPARKRISGSDARSSQSTGMGNTPTMNASDQELDMPSVKGLDSSEPSIRRTTLHTLLQHFESRPASAPLSPTQCLQLWRGLFVVVYMHDSRNMLSVQNVLREIADTFITISSKDHQRPTPNGESRWLDRYHTAFWETVQREWAQIDSHRMNKYLLLIRFVMRNLFTICLRPVYEHKSTSAASAKPLKSKSKAKASKQGKSGESMDIMPLENYDDRTKKVKAVLETVGPLNPTLRKIPDGLRLHIFDIWNDELFGAISDLEENHALEENDEEGIRLRKQMLFMSMNLLKDSVNLTTPGDSGAQKHIRTRAKEAIKEMEEKSQLVTIEQDG